MSLVNWTNDKSTKDSLPILKNVLIPDQPELLIKLAEGIVKIHTTLGPASPISGTLAAEINFKVNFAKEKHDEGMKCLKMAAEALADRDAILGNKQGFRSEHTSLKFFLKCVGDILSQEENDKILTDWGFIVKN